MKRMRSVAALVVGGVVVVIGGGSVAAESPITLQEALRLGAKRPAAIAASDRASAASDAADVEWRRAVLPSLSVDASGQQRSRRLTLATPDGVLEVADKRRLAATVGVRQPILNPAQLLYNAPAARSEAEAAALSATRARDIYAANAGQRYYDVLELDARATAIVAHVASLESRLAEIETLVAEGRAIDADRRRLRLALDDQRLRRDNLARQREVATLALGHAVGRDRAVEPAPHTNARAPAATRVARRGDIVALDHRRQAAMKRRAGVRAEWLPSLSVDGAWIYDDGLFADQDNFFAVTLNLSWTPLAGGTRSARRRALASEASALARQSTELARQVSLEQAAAERAIESARAALEIATRGIEDAIEARRVTLQRYAGGRETVGDVLDVEALVSERRTARDVASIALARAILDQRLARGALIE